ncbi:hypothetical protein M3Y99_01605600 [Aphelenchoides fujianensis]|nr:hypothetical protein M3Y99_01605600 [Aphelenchoides fujianensis]
MNAQEPGPAGRIEAVAPPVPHLTITLNNAGVDQPPGFSRQYVAALPPRFHRPPDLLSFHPHHAYARLPPNIAASSASTPSTPTATTVSLNRSQRCGQCRGCTRKPCGVCTFCLDSPLFGGPGVKKQSCLERRCLRDCLTCLVCLDKRFFENRFMPGALCAKKRCNNSTNLELPMAAERQALKRSYDGRNVENGSVQPLRPQLMPQTSVFLHSADGPAAKRPEFVHAPHPYLRNLADGQVRIAAPHPHFRFPTHPNFLNGLPMPDPNFCPPPAHFGFPPADYRPPKVAYVTSVPAPVHEIPPAKPFEADRLHYPTEGLLSTSPLLPISFEALESGMGDFAHEHDLLTFNGASSMFPHAHEPKEATRMNPVAVECDAGDPFIPPSFAPEMQNAVILQQL